jgi:hypothetical protein
VRAHHLFLQRVVGAALEFAEDPLEVSKLDVLHVLRKNKRFLGRVVTTYEHLQKFNLQKSNPDSIGACSKSKVHEVYDKMTFDNAPAPPSSGEAALPTADTRHDFSDVGRDASGGQTAGAPRVISFKMRKTA